MKNKKYLAVAMLAGLTFGGLSVAGVASAQGYGSNDAAETTETTDSIESTDGTVLQIQDEAQDSTDDTETDDGATDDDRRGRRGGCNLDEAAAAIGIDEADLQAALDNGDTIADVAAANGVDVDDVIDAMVEAKADRIADKVDDGRITQDEADEKLADLEDRITDRVNGVDDDEEDNADA